MSGETIVSLIFGVLTLCATTVGCTWTLCDRLGKLVTQSQCAERRTACLEAVAAKRRSSARVRAGKTKSAAAD
ncbi:MAG: hypothetical protein PHI85_10585 [Victivallaceae bacterium]|nr:hypothetical protein [Victivallaceae bacterium]